MPAMSDGIRPLDEPRKLRSQTLSESCDKSPTRSRAQRFANAGRTVKNFFNGEKRTSKRRASSALINSPKEEMATTNGIDGAQDIGAIFEDGVSKSLSQRSHYDKRRTGLLTKEASNSWDHHAFTTASEAELKAARAVLRIREHERENLYGNKASEAVPGPETRDMGGQFLTNKPTIEKSKLYEIAYRMPKGAELHLHFNSEFPPQLLLREMEKLVPNNMFVRSTQPILSESDVSNTEIVFSVMPKETPSADTFSESYKPDFKNTTNNPWMKWTEFCDAMKAKFAIDAIKWIPSKMVLGEEEVYGIRQTTNGVWARFNQGTRCFKGLTNYASIYRWYVGELIDAMIREHVMYAELRPMLLDKSIPSDDGTTPISIADQMRIIIEEWDKKKAQLEKENRQDDFPFCPRIIYCTPRSIPKDTMKRELQDCLKLKLEFPDLICGFDLVGAEDRPNHIGYYKDELLAFVEACKTLKVDIPFLFHAGETLLDRGGSRDPSNSNLYDSLLLHAKRIGHGFSLVSHPELAEEFRKQKICIELCPTSNELLHLCRNIKEHPYPQLLALGIPCTVNSDNPSLFSSTLSFEFYQVMVGSTTMNLHGWKQLALWSLEYSCLPPEQARKAKEIFMRKWEEFCNWVNETYGTYANDLDIDV